MSGNLVSAFTPPNKNSQLGYITLPGQYLLTDATVTVPGVGQDLFRTLKYRRLAVADPLVPGVVYAGRATRSI